MPNPISNRVSVRSIVLLVGTLLLGYRPVEASTIQIDLVGAVTSVDPALAGTFSVNDAIAVSLQYDSLTPDSIPDASTGGYYSAVTSVQATIGGYSITGSGALGGVFISNSFSDEFRASSNVTGAQVNGYDHISGTGFFVTLRGPSTVFASDALPTSLNLADFSLQKQFRLDFRDLSCGPATGGPCETAQVLGTFTTLTAADTTVPEPGTLLLVGGGLLASSIRKRVRR